MIERNPYQFIWLRLCICSLACCISFSLHAQQTGDTIPEKVHNIPEVGVTARRMPQRISVSAPVQAFGDKEFKTLGLQNIADAVKRFAGASVRDYGGIGGLKSVSVRSLGAPHTAVAYDGVAVSNCQAGQIDIGRFSLDEVDMLSLSVGQDETLLQPARLFASAGVLSIYSKNPLEGSSKQYSFKGSVKSGSFGLLNPSVMWAQRIAPRTNYSISANYQRADGRYPFTLVNGKEVTKEKRRNSDIESWHSELNLFHTLKDSSQWQLKAYYFDSERGLPGSIILYSNVSTQRLWDKNFFLQTQYKRDLGRKWALLAQAKYNYSWNKYEDTDVKYQDGKQTDINRQQEYYLSAALQWQPIKSLSTSWANDLVLNTLHNNMPQTPLPVRYSWISALSIRHQWHGLTTTATLTNTFIAEEVKRGNRPDNRKRLCPTISLLYRPYQNKNLFFRAMYKSTFRVPSFNDLYYQRVGNTTLKPEKAQEFNVGVTWSGSPFTFTNYVALTADVYINKVEDKIVALPTTYIWKMLNYGKVDIAGADITLRTAIPLGRLITLSLTGNYTYQKAIDVTSKDDKNYKDQIPYTPKHSGNASAIIETPLIDLGYTATGVSERYYLPQNTEANRIDGYVEHTITASRTFSVGKCQMRLQGELINFTNQQYDIIKYYPMPGRSFRITGSISF